MMNDKGQDQELSKSDAPCRRRGRPTGKNRIPLSREERRARNAQYERERRSETAEVMSQLIESVSCDPNISNADLLATVISRIQRAARKNEDISELERVNANLEAQIATLQNRLGVEDATLELLDDENNGLDSIRAQSNSENSTEPQCNLINYNLRKQVQTKKRKRSDRCSSENEQEKRTKTKSETWSVDSGIELRSHTVSPAAYRVENNMEYLINTEQQQLPVEITEDDHSVSLAHMELQTELYNQIYNSESQSSAGSETVWGIESLPTQSYSCMESLSRSLIVVPSIVPPQQDPPDLRVQPHTQPELSSLENVELTCDINFRNDYDLLQEHDDAQPTLDFLTDTEKGLLNDWIGAELLENSGIDSQTQMPLRNYTIDEMLSGY